LYKGTLNTPLTKQPFQELKSKASGIVTIAAKPIIKLSSATKELIGKRPAYNLTVSYQRNGKNVYISDFNKGIVTLGIAYKVTSSEKIGNLYGVYVGKDGKPQLLTKSSYVSGWLIFSRNILLTYGVGYKNSASTFTDTAKHWAKDSIDFVTSRKMIIDTGKTIFSPNTAITRGDFLTALGNLSGVDVSVYNTSRLKM